MAASPAAPPQRVRVSKGAVNCQQRRKATVTGYRAGAQPLIEVRVFADSRDQGAFFDLSVSQAREFVRLLQTALAAHDGLVISLDGCEPAGVDLSHARSKA